MPDAYNLQATLSSGQTFAFVCDAEGYVGIVQGKPVSVRARDGRVSYDCRAGDEAFFQRYFDIERDYAALFQKFDSDAHFQLCAGAFAGMRVLRQPVWETVCAFILSAMNHQSRIELLYRTISERLGEPMEWAGRTLYAFPPPQKLAASDESLLREIGAGFRAPYLIQTARAVADGFSLNLDGLEYDEALKHLARLSGVGEKVADCVLLFSSRHSLAFPVDVWIERVLRERYGLTGSKRDIKRGAQAMFGQDAGIAQQYLFHGARTGILGTFEKGRR